MKSKEISLIFGYLLAAGLANLLVKSLGAFGPAVSILTAFLLIGLNITTRDVLHRLWEGKDLWFRMSMLILLGAAISYIAGAGSVALASMIAFAASEFIDALVFTLLARWGQILRMNGSNAASAAVDSVLFPLFAFPPPLSLPIVLGQAVAKIGGGFVWSLVLGKSEHNNASDTGR